MAAASLLITAAALTRAAPELKVRAQTVNSIAIEVATGGVIVFNQCGDGITHKFFLLLELVKLASTRRPAKMRGSKIVLSLPWAGFPPFAPLYGLLRTITKVHNSRSGPASDRADA